MIDALAAFIGPADNGWHDEMHFPDCAPDTLLDLLYYDHRDPAVIAEIFAHDLGGC
jgi:hypothetical protein